MHQTKIILAEDDLDDRLFFNTFLQDRTDILLLPAVENGVELLQYLDSLPHDADLPQGILLDQNMPLKNGINTLRSLKSTDRYRHIPVMVYSTYTDENLVNECLSSGALKVITKPTNAPSYNKMIDELLLVTHTNK